MTRHDFTLPHSPRQKQDRTILLFWHKNCHPPLTQKDSPFLFSFPSNSSSSKADFRVPFFVKHKCTILAKQLLYQRKDSTADRRAGLGATVKRVSYNRISNNKSCFPVCRRGPGSGWRRAVWWARCRWERWVLLQQTDRPAADCMQSRGTNYSVRVKFKFSYQLTDIG